MKKIRELVAVSAGFPNKKSIYKYKFFEQIINEFVKADIKVTVISPIYLNHYHDYYKSEWSYEIDGNEIKVYQPLIINYSTKNVGGIRLGKFSYMSFKRAVEKTMIKNRLTPDVLYSHFITPSGCVASELGLKYGIPSFCAVGESNILDTFQSLGKKYIKERFSNISGVISVSSENKDIIKSLKICDESPIIVLPNGVNFKEFYPHDKIKMRLKYGFNQDDIIGIFVGAFIDRKGAKRVQQASDITGLKMIYVGSGEEKPVGDNVIFNSVVNHNEISELLSAADFFVLPTKEEGCCNAIIEAIACGLPIISSNGKFNDDILSSEYSIRVNPENIQDIANAMLTLINNVELRKKMSEASIKARDKFGIKNRAIKIIDFMSIY